MSAKNKGIGGTLKGLRVNDLEISFQKNLSEKTRSLKSSTKKFHGSGFVCENSSCFP